MYVVNFDFSQHYLPFKLLVINLPVIFTEMIAYPLQRIQTLIISSKSYVTNNQFTQSQYLLRLMWGTQGLPKLLHGMRYSIDYSGTMMTTKFLTFDFLMNQIHDGQINKINRWAIMGCCFFANAFSTAVAQIAFNYQILASSLPIDKNNLSENVKYKLQEYTKKNKFPINGLKFTLPASICNTALELAVLSQINTIMNGLQTDRSSYIFEDLFAAFCIFTITSFPTHYAFQRQIQICLNMKKNSIEYSKGLLTTLLRQNMKGMILFGTYLAYFQYKTQSQFAQLMASRRNHLDSPMAYRA